MTSTLDLTSDKLSPEDIDALTRDLSEAVRDLNDLNAEPVRQAAQPGERGALAVVGKLLIDFVGTSAASELIKVLGAFFNREKTLEGKITFPDGTMIEVNAKNLSDKDFQSRLDTMIQSTRAE